MIMVIAGIKLIRHNMAGVNLPDEPEFPFKLTLILQVPQFMEVAAAFLYGNETVVVIGKTREALEEFAARNDFLNHPRFIKLEILDKATGQVTETRRPDACPVKVA